MNANNMLSVKEIIQQTAKSCETLSQTMDTFEKHLGEWAKEKNTTFKTLEQSQIHNFQVASEQINNLKQQYEETNQRRMVLEEKTKQEFEAEERLQQELKLQQEYERTLPDQGQILSSELEEIKKQVEIISEKLRILENEKQRKINEESQILQFYEYYLGLTFQRVNEEGNWLLVNFLGIGSFKVKIENNIYSVSNCVPAIPFDDLIENLNQTNNFQRFVILMRQRFVNKNRKY
ncbi:hypothetical protein ABK040_004813 [Willaertia magna]